MIDNSLAYRLHSNVRVPASVLCFHTQMAQHVCFSLVYVTLNVKKYRKLWFFFLMNSVEAETVKYLCGNGRVETYEEVFGFKYQRFLALSLKCSLTNPLDIIRRRNVIISQSDVMIVIYLCFSVVLDMWKVNIILKLIAGVSICREHGFGQISWQFQKD